MNDSDISVTNAEIQIDAAINLLNTYGAGLDNLTGAAGAKTGSYTSSQAGAIMTMAQKVYATRYKNADESNVQVSTVGVTFPSNQQILSFARMLAFRLIGRDFEKTG